MVVVAGLASLAALLGAAVWAYRRARHDQRRRTLPAELSEAAMAVSVRLVSALIAEQEAILAFVPPNECQGRLASRPPATWGTLCAHLARDTRGEDVLDRWRDDQTVLMLRAEGGHRLHLASSEDELWLLLD